MEKRASLAGLSSAIIYKGLTAKWSDYENVL